MKRFGRLIGISLLVLLDGLLYRIFSTPIQYEIPGGFHGWLIVQWSEQHCPPLRQGIFLVVRLSDSGVACTSSPFWADLNYIRFEYVYPDGARRSLRWNEHGKGGTQVWLVGYSNEEKTEEIFVGDEHENWGSYPRPHLGRR